MKVTPIKISVTVVSKRLPYMQKGTKDVKHRSRGVYNINNRNTAYDVGIIGMGVWLRDEM